MKPKIEHPHVFISYAWGDQENQQKVIEFAKSLMECGINVELDKWSLKEGNDTYAYMEQMVNNKDITNVLILLDKNYTKKANERKGGVGTETQILSPEIYEKVSQDKFIPIVFSRGPNGEISKPTFLKQLLHFDLSLDNKYSSEFQRLVKRLFGIEIHEKPELGNPPSWLEDNENAINPKIAFTKIINANNSKEKQYEIKLAFANIKSSILECANNLDSNNNKCIDSYKLLQVYRDNVLSLIETCLWFDGIGVEIATFLEKTKNAKVEYGIKEDLKDTLVHELFIYIVGMFLKTHNYQQLSYLLNKTYFPIFKYDDPASFDFFYNYNQVLDSAVSIRDNKRYHCGTAQLWMETIDINHLSKNELIAADILLHNVAIFGKKHLNYRAWFPITYVYDETNNFIRDFGKRLASREYLNEMKVVFGFEDIKDFVNNIKSFYATNEDRTRYPGAWHEVPLIIDFIKSEDIGKYN